MTNRRPPQKKQRTASAKPTRSGGAYVQLGGEETVPRMILVMRTMGASANEIAAAFGVSIATIDKWKRTKPEVKEAFALGVQAANSRVSSALFQLCIGGSYQVDQAIKVKDRAPDGSYSECVEVVTLTKNQPPLFHAISFWLRHRDAENWANPEADPGEETPLQSQDDAALRARAQELMKRVGTNVVSLKG